MNIYGQLTGKAKGVAADKKDVAGAYLFARDATRQCYPDTGYDEDRPGTAEGRGRSDGLICWIKRCGLTYWCLIIPP
jgi:hypothetical protein